MDVAFSFNDDFVSENFGNFENSAEKRCCHCSRVSTFVCSRCNAFYCSKKCSNIDWPKHRSECLVKPPLIKFDAALNNGHFSEIDFARTNDFQTSLFAIANVCRDLLNRIEICIENQSAPNIKNATNGCSNIQQKIEEKNNKKLHNGFNTKTNYKQKKHHNNGAENFESLDASDVEESSNIKDIKKRKSFDAKTNFERQKFTNNKHQSMKAAESSESLDIDEDESCKRLSTIEKRDKQISKSSNSKVNFEQKELQNYIRHSANIGENLETSDVDEIEENGKRIQKDSKTNLKQKKLVNFMRQKIKPTDSLVSLEFNDVKESSKNPPTIDKTNKQNRRGFDSKTNFEQRKSKNYKLQSIKPAESSESLEFDDVKENSQSPSTIDKTNKQNRKVFDAKTNFAQKKSKNYKHQGIKAAESSESLDMDDIENSNKKDDLNETAAHLMTSTSDISSNLLIKSNDIDNLNVDSVYITSFRSSNRVGVCPKSKCDDDSYEQLLQRINYYGQNAPILESVPEQDTYVITLRTGKFARAKVLHQKIADPQRIRVDFIDYGNMGYRKLKDLRKISMKIQQLPVYTTIVQLSDIDLVEFNDRAKRLCSTFEKKFYKLKKVDDNGLSSLIKVELYDLNTGQSLNENLKNGFKEINDESKPTQMSTNHKTYTKVKKEKIYVPKNKRIGDEKKNAAIQKEYFDANESTDEEKSSTVQSEQLGPNNKISNKEKSSIVKEENLGPVLKAPFQEKCFSRKMRNIQAIVVDTSEIESGIISCISENHKPELQKIQLFLQNVKKSKEPYHPVQNEYVIAQFDEDKSWYRAKVKHIFPEEDKFEVSYIDFQNCALVSSNDIRRYPEELIVDCCTTLCLLAGLPKVISNDLKEFLSTEINLNDTIIIDRIVDKIDGNIMLIECRELMDQMYEKDLI